MENPFKWRHYKGKIILLAVRWYLRYALSYRDLAEMLSERGLGMVASTIFRWVQAFGFCCKEFDEKRHQQCEWFPLKYRESGVV